jgi:hypothetical protein
MMETSNITIRLIERRDWAPDAQIVTCTSLRQAKRSFAAWNVAQKDRVWFDANAITDPPIVVFEANLIGESRAIVEFFSLSCLERWLVSMKKP